MENTDTKNTTFGAARQSVARKLKALLAKAAPGSGATEAEIAAAMAKAEEMMAKYRISKDEIDPEQEGTEKLTIPDDLLWGVRVRMDLVGTIAKFCHAKGFYNSTVGTVTFFGMFSDVTFAEWLLETLVAHVKRAVEAYKLDSVLDAKSFVKHDERGVVIGCIQRLNERLREATVNANAMAESRGDNKNALVVVRDAIMIREWNKLGIRLYAGSANAKASGSVSGASFGRRAADSASFNRPVGGASGPRLLK